MNDKIRWGVLAAGTIAKAFVTGVQQSETGTLAAVASRDVKKAEAFAETFGIPVFHGSYEALLADPTVDAVYISTPHPLHTEWAIKAAEAGKHILCEKPLALNQYETQSIVEAADVNGVFLMEAYMYRCHPQTAKVLELLQEGILGEVRVIKATFSFGNGFREEGRHWENALGGGGILDVGGYTTSYACMVAGTAEGRSFAVPSQVKGVGVLSQETGVDGIASALLEFDSGIIAECSTGIAVGQENCVQIFGSQGWIKIPDPYVASRTDATTGCIQVFTSASRELQEITVEAPVTSYAYEVDACGRAILAGKSQPGAPAMSWEDSIANAKVLDAWRKEAGVEYEQEKPEQMPSVTFAGRPLEHRKPLMKPGEIEFVGKPVSRLIMGVDGTMRDMGNTLCNNIGYTWAEF